MTWEASVARVTENFFEGAAKKGFVIGDEANTLKGVVTIPRGASAGEVPLRIRIPEEFPFRPPKAQPVEATDRRSWHREPDGTLCLYAEADSGDLPWLDPHEFLDRVVTWFIRDETEWQDDSPDLDLERYFKRASGLATYADLPEGLGKPISARWRNNVLQVIGTGRLSGTRRHVIQGRAEDLGELNLPVRNWPEIAEVLGERSNRLEFEINNGTVKFLLVRYRRKGYESAVVLTVANAKPIVLESMETADRGIITLRLRSGSAAEVLKVRSIAIVGVGAVGSFVADLLARGGIGRLTLQDGEIVRPGNCVRHLLDASFVGKNKAAAVAAKLLFPGPMTAAQLAVIPTSLTSPVDAWRLLHDHDLVIDATANGPTTAMLGVLAKQSHRNLLSIALLDEGDIIRCDRWPLREGEQHLASPRGISPPRRQLREGGCGDPVSVTAPHAVFEAAGLAVRMATDLLSGRNQLAPSISLGFGFQREFRNIRGSSNEQSAQAS